MTKIKVSIKRVIITALIGGAIFTAVVSGFDYVFGKPFSWPRLGLYFGFATLMYGFLTWRNLRKGKR
ncbi:hypothetical protein ESY86_00345 [Subsaximicrobium wynnwilliamsii]|uniref:Uncharacterized protein n=1 Tax=Subsaximicrobium wynnwilliamsii TaxID=291179 RepID=A0A5C6ZMB1_9FLAO|nr:hypothetical protein [Subsaximicrobium wynnwilliamsii]TXD85039.1 hypothetical protein ESY87_01515 [Subsaximicrobium wynnwilliamsii]TXD91082.1 hypothetical protein ESY86_00345 [Subsaximicrobium wynnwilliamsii]TXE04476.1 hypothetical protein ESY88_02995 [Subsaximicrobium wynnwilliamsii]